MTQKQHFTYLDFLLNESSINSKLTDVKAKLGQCWLFRVHIKLDGIFRPLSKIEGAQQYGILSNECISNFNNWQIGSYPGG